LSQPIGHVSQGSGWKASNTDNPAVLGPAGTVHSSLEDIGNYIAAHLAGARGDDIAGLLTAAEFNKLHTATENSNYTLGWVIADNTTGHNSSNTIWLADIKIFSEKIWLYLSQLMRPICKKSKAVKPLKLWQN
jgi:hypothetical protein